MSDNIYFEKLYATHHDLPEGTRKKLVEILNHSLTASVDLKSQVKQAHWNVKGINFLQLHELFDTLAGELEGYVDSLAERITTLGGVACGTVRLAAQDSILPEYPLDILDGKLHLTALVERYAIYAKMLRELIDKTGNLGDAGTADLFTEISREVDKRLWFLESHLLTA